LHYVKLTGADKATGGDSGPGAEFAFADGKVLVGVQFGLSILGLDFREGSLAYSQEGKDPGLEGNISYDGDTPFGKSPSIGVRWSKEKGLQVTKWPGAFAFDGDFAGALKIAGSSDPCKALGEFVVDKVWRGRRRSHPLTGTYQTMIGYGAQWFEESHSLLITAGDVSIAGVPVSALETTATTLDFIGQSDASRAGKPWAGHLDFADGRCTGWCQFPGEGRGDWRGTFAG